jgi:hypothetical protein
VGRHRNVDVSLAVPGVAVFRGDRPGEDDAIRADAGNEHVERVAVVLESQVGTDDDERRVRRVVAPVERERLDDVLEPLVRDDPPHR